jgi:hypothetical protein
MAYTLAQLTTEVRNILNEDSAVFWSDAEIQGWIQQATIDISSKLLSAVTESTITLVQNQWIYSSTDAGWLATMLRVKEAYITDSSSNVYGMGRAKIKQVGHIGTKQTAGIPKVFIEENRKLYIWPKPSATYAGDTITCVHAYETDDCTALHDEHQPYCILYAAAKAKFKDKMFQEAAAYMDQYQRALIFERQDKFQIPVDSTDSFKRR